MHTGPRVECCPLPFAAIYHRHTSAAHDRISLGAAPAYARPSHQLKRLRLLAAVALLLLPPLPRARTWHPPPLVGAVVPVRTHTRAGTKLPHDGHCKWKHLGDSPRTMPRIPRTRSPFFPMPSPSFSLLHAENRDAYATHKKVRSRCSSHTHIYLYIDIESERCA